MRTEDIIWNRACEGGGANPHNGDKALAALLVAHGLTMNGGVLHAVECLDADELADAKFGYCYFGYDSVAELITRARQLYEEDEYLESHELEFDDEYATLIPSDSALAQRFEERYKEQPTEFAPHLRGV
ncbi:MAG: hypothetical protein NUW37_19605 [Planctomycetes bacterium]|nr:hypothetical protein [Planctomycetota bacterium]